MSGAGNNQAINTINIRVTSITLSAPPAHSQKQAQSLFVFPYFIRGSQVHNGSCVL